ncbi:MAG: biotin--[acetyl-CoA-carboxylase] ligase [Myxococcales bacterium]|nr:biotin--[acetyl-CoA-carboxylase] ligase [Myxococcales bacterium]
MAHGDDMDGYDMDGIVWLDVCGSTNDEAWLRVDDSAVRAVAAEAQTAGRGRRGRRWLSPTGCGLYLSYVARPAFAPSLGAALPLMAAVAVAEVVGALGVGAVVKWPNDVLVGGRKLAGILCEARGAGRDWRAVLGVGVNRVAPPGGWPDDVPGVALGEVVGAAPSGRALAGALVGRLDAWMAVVAAEGLAPVLEAWHRHAPPAGTRMRRGALVGAFVGLGADGGLRLRSDDGVVHVVHAGEVDLVTHG